MRILKLKTKSGMETKGFELTETEFQNADNESQGYCIECGDEAYGVEPDARKYECESCEKHGVFGASELLMMGRIRIVA
jgi:hypothetical protein